MLWPAGSSTSESYVLHPELTSGANLRFAEESAVRSQLRELILRHVPSEVGLAVRQELGEVPKGHADVVHVPKTGRDTWRASDASPVVALRNQQECEMCGLLATDLVEVMNSTQRRLEAKRTSLARRASASHKAQTKRWLDHEYGAEVLAALEEALEVRPTRAPLCSASADAGAVPARPRRDPGAQNLCPSGRLERLACEVQTFISADGVFAGNSSLRRAPGEQARRPDRRSPAHVCVCARSGLAIWRAGG